MGTTREGGPRSTSGSSRRRTDPPERRDGPRGSCFTWNVPRYRCRPAGHRDGPPARPVPEVPRDSLARPRLTGGTARGVGRQMFHVERSAVPLPAEPGHRAGLPEAPRDGIARPRRAARAARGGRRETFQVRTYRCRQNRDLATSPGERSVCEAPRDGLGADERTGRSGARPKADPAYCHRVTSEVGLRSASGRHREAERTGRSGAMGPERCFTWNASLHRLLACRSG